MNKISFDEFKSEVVERVLEFLPESFVGSDVSLNIVTKPNGIKLTGLSIRKDGSNIAPNIYLEEFYSQLEAGDNIGVVLRRIADLRMTQDVEDIDFEMFLDFENCKDKIMPRLYGVELNNSMIEERVYTKIGDFIILYVLELGENGRGRMCIPINYQLLNTWNIKVEEIHKIALDNQHIRDDGVVRTMSEMMKDMVYPGLLEEMEVDEDKAYDLIDEMFDIPDDRMMYVISNKSGTNGASIILDEEFMESVYKKIGKDFYILPSSIHEVLAVADDGYMDAKDMQMMVYEINRSQVSVEDRLSDHIYKYTKETGLVRAV